ncbi:hypothetical protein [Vagococcus silagei]|uniref:Uncharacterized protein n=1 Tax=Vagococcus silagei TaxID=2508885 RepID=A0A4S3B1J1_9ENTE|nr:hypothetical protein [Vagococcus silagei]THB60984.1 hypothetical protein ESZ54_08435 [Vagococcus silagei]
MHFVTEIELRSAYRKNPFSAYTLSENDRLTPEARQFLVDRNISFNDFKGRYQQNKTTKPTNDSQLNDDQKAEIEWLRLEFFQAISLANTLNLTVSEKLIDILNQLMALEELSMVDNSTETDSLIVNETYTLSLAQALSDKGPLLIQLNKIIFLLTKLEKTLSKVHSQALGQIKIEIQASIEQLLGGESDDNS